MDYNGYMPCRVSNGLAPAGVWGDAEGSERADNEEQEERVESTLISLSS